MTLEALIIDNHYSLKNIKANGSSKGSANSTGLKLSIIVCDDITQIEKEWRLLEKLGGKSQLESPGQSYDFILLWIDIFKVAKTDQSFFVVLLDGAPIVGMAFEMDRHLGVNVLVPYGAYHVGSGAPLVDRQKMASLSKSQQAEVWQALKSGFKGVDIAFFRFVPQYHDGDKDIFSNMGVSVLADNLYRAKFDSWESCNKLQLTRSRRKHDKQHSKKLNAMGEVSFEEISAKSPKAKNIINIMFAQRAKRFAVQGIDDPFADENRKEFYHKAGALEGDLSGVLHVLRLNNEIIAVRYNLVHGDKMFSLISSMSEDIDIQKAAPGKQSLLRVMQTIFDNGIRTYDMGAGLTDEKRHWCNEILPLRHYYVPLTPLGHVIARGHRYKKFLRYQIKNNTSLNRLAKKIRAMVHKFK